MDNDKQKEQLIFGYKVGIAFSYLLNTMFVLGIISLIYNIYDSIINNTFSIFNIVILVFGIPFMYFIFFKSGSFLRKSCRKQLKNLDNSYYIYPKVIDIKNTVVSASTSFHRGQTQNTATQHAVKYYLENNIEVIRIGTNKNDIQIGDKIKVLVWSDKYRTYYEYADKP